MNFLLHPSSKRSQPQSLFTSTCFRRDCAGSTSAGPVVNDGGSWGEGEKRLAKDCWPWEGWHGRVCVVGAGPAGLHMALRLKEKGYTKVNLLEKTSLLWWNTMNYSSGKWRTSMCVPMHCGHFPVFFLQVSLPNILTLSRSMRAIESR